MGERGKRDRIKEKQNVIEIKNKKTEMNINLDYFVYKIYMFKIYNIIEYLLLFVIKYIFKNYYIEKKRIKKILRIISKLKLVINLICKVIFYSFFNFNNVSGPIN